MATIGRIYAAGMFSAENERRYRAILADLGIPRRRTIRHGVRKRLETNRRELERYIQPNPHDLQTSYYRDGYKH